MKPVIFSIIFFSATCLTARSVNVGMPLRIIFTIFYMCPLFIRQRFELFKTLRKFNEILSVEILLNCSSELSIDENTEIVLAVHDFLSSTRRFV